MRKGADVLSKWVGEAEKQLRLLFEAATRQQPSIIFFDEIDGLAPVRSSRQVRSHISASPPPAAHALRSPSIVFLDPPVDEIDAHRNPCDGNVRTTSTHQSSPPSSP